NRRRVDGLLGLSRVPPAASPFRPLAQHRRSPVQRRTRCAALPGREMRDMTGRDALLAGARRYYAARLREHGATARGVDWNSAEGQTTRFAQLARLWAQDR